MADTLALLSLVLYTSIRVFASWLIVGIRFAVSLAFGQVASTDAFHSHALHRVFYRGKVEMKNSWHILNLILIEYKTNVVYTSVYMCVYALFFYEKKHDMGKE